MAEVKWIKITTDIFDDEKILLIESLPDSYAIITVWFKLLCLAGKQNNSGVFMMGRIAYTDKMLATIFRMKESTVTMALQTFQQFGMVEIVDGVITIPNWGKHQSLDAYEKKKIRDRERIARKRAEQKALIGMSPDKSHDKSPDVAFSEGDIEEEKDKEIDNIPSGEVPPAQPKINYQEIVDLFNNTCKSLPKVRALTDARRAAIKSRLNRYTVDDLKTVFEKAEASSFLKGTDGGWKASFDWLIKESNMVKVMEDNYVDKAPRYGGRKEKLPGWMMQPSMELGSAEMDAIKKALEDDTDFQEEAEQLRRELEASFGRKP